MDFSKLKGKTVVITGASRGIGKATAELLLEYGVNLVLGARTVEDLKLLATYENVTVIRLDVSDEKSVQQFVTKTINQHGKVDVLINAAGIGKFSSILDSDTEDFDEMISVNLRGTYLTCKYFGRIMKAQKEGQILNLVSIAATIALPGNGAYASSKFGVYGFTKVLQSELRGHGIRITSVLPGAIDSTFWDQINPKPDTSAMIPMQSIRQHIMYLLCQPDHSVVDEITIMPPAGIL